MCLGVKFHLDQNLRNQNCLEQYFYKTNNFKLIVYNLTVTLVKCQWVETNLPSHLDAHSCSNLPDSCI